MHTNPICHWAQSGRIPLFEMDVRDGPVDQVFPATGGALAAVLPNAASPAHLYLCDAEQGNNEQDLVGAYHLVPTNAPLQNQPARGIFYGGSWTGKRCVEFERSTQQSLVAQLNTWFDYPVGTSVAFMGVTKGYDDDQSLQLFSKRNTLSSAGYYATLSGTNVINSIVTGAGTNGTLGNYSGGWNAFVWVLHRANAQQYAATPWRTATAVLAASAITNGVLFRLGGGPAGAGAPRLAARGAFAYFAVFEGAEAEKFSSDAVCLAAMRAFWKNGYPRMDLLKANGLPKNNADLVFARSDAAPQNTSTATVVDAANNLVEASPEEPVWRYSALFAHATKLGFWYRSANYTLKILRSDDFSDALWVKTAMTVDETQANSAISPAGMKIANLLTATADDALAHYQFTCTAGQDFCPGVWIRRGSAEVSDVTGHLDFYSVTGGATLYTTPFVATADWQHIPINGGAFIAPGGITAQLRIYIDDNGRSIHAFRAHAVQDTRDPFIAPYTSAGVTTESSTTYQTAESAPAGDWMKGAKGEIEATLVTNCAVLPIANNATVLDTDDAAAGDNDRRIERFDATQHGEGRAYTNVGALADTVDSGVAIDASVVETDFRYQWDAANPSLGGRHSRLIINAVEYLGAVAGWAHSDLVKKLWLGVNDAAIEPLQGVMSRLRIFDQT